MATKMVQPIAIELGIKGGEKLGALNRAFRDLSKQTKLADKDIVQATKDIVNFSKDLNASEATIKGQIKALEGLREQAAIGGKVYGGLSRGITELKARLNGSTSAIDAQRKSLLETAGSVKATQAQLLNVANALSTLQKQTALGSKAFVELGADIASLEGKIAKVKTEQEELNKLNFAANQIAAGGAGATRRQIKAIDARVASLREEKRVREELEAQKRVRQGMQEILDRPGDVPFRTREYIEQAVATSLLAEEGLPGKRLPPDLNILKMFAPGEILAAVEAVKKSVAELQVEIERDLGRSARRAFQEMAREGRESARSLAIAFSGLEFERIFANLEKNVGELPDTTAGLSQRLRELERVLNNTARGGNNYVAVALEIARVQREASAATQGLGAALIKDLASGVAVRNQKNLREAIGQLQAEMSELNTETAEGSAKYAENARQVNRLQKELDQISNSYRTVADVARQAGMAMGGSLNPFTVAGGRRRATPDFAAYEQPIGPEISPAAKQAAEDRKQEIRDRIANLKRINAENDALREQRAIRRSIAKNREKVAALAGIDRPMREISGLYKGIADIGMSKIAADIDRMGNSYYQVANDIKNATKASNGSINSLQAQRNAWASLRAGLDPTSKAYEDVGREIEKVDRRLEKLNRSRRRMSPMQMTQAAGAAISGGIFGGPEGFLGGVGGALVGGVGGAFAGAAFGAQVGGIRRTLGEYTEYAAQIARLKIALEGIAGSQNQYNRALAAAADVTKSLNVPQDVAIQGITRLTAAVKGAGGGVADAELAFKNINSAIIATGGGAEQVEGAVTALVQIFSKGKVSAEEINQIAERLPGTFNKIAAASGRTGPELTKALQDGKVGLNDLMKFLVSLGDEYGELAGKIAGSSENAGARLRVAFDQMRVEVGNALQPIGAEFQDIFTEFIEDITPTLVAVLPKIGKAFLVIAKNIDTVVVAMTAALGVFAVGKIAAIIGSIGSLAAAIFTLKLNAVAAAKALVGLNTAAMLNPYTALAAGVAAFATNLFLANKRQRELNNLIRQGPVAEVQSKISKLQSEQAEIEQRSIAPKSATQKALDLAGRVATSTLFVDSNEDDRRRLAEIKDLLPKLRERLRVAEYDARQGAALDSSTFGLTVFDEPKPDGTGTGTGTGGVRQSRLGAIQAAEQLLGIEKQILDNARQIGVAQAGSNFERVNQLNNQKISLEFAKRAAENQFELNEALARAAGDKNEAALKAEAFAKKEISDKLLLIQYESALADEAQRRALAEEERNKAMSDQLFTLREQLGLVTDDERIARFRQEQEKQFGKDDPRAAEATDLFRRQVAPTFAEGLGQKIRELKGELKELVNPINQITFAANTIGTAFSNAFGQVITGSKSVKEALSDAFASIGKAFLDMATQIIAKQLVLITLGLIQKALGVGVAASSGSSPAVGASTVQDGGSFNLPNEIIQLGGPSDFAAKGAYFDGQTARFAKGGIVSAPTPFKFSDGGTIKNGLMGEVGPEAILPLERGADGKLGVKASIPFVAGASSVNNNFQQLQSVQLPFTRTSERIETERQERERISAMQDPGSIDVRYESTVINNTEYVTAEQHRRGMAQAAEQGRALTLVALQNSVKTRRKVGL